MRLLLDTHTMLWTLFERDRLSTKARAAIEAEENEIFVSVVSPWELAIKRSHRPIEVADEVIPSLQRQRFEILPVLLRHTIAIEGMPYHHRDPFDRMLVAQAVTDGMTIVTSDRKLRRYSVSLMPAT